MGSLPEEPLFLSTVGLAMRRGWLGGISVAEPNRRVTGG
jgi:hypothetical protein